MLNTEVDGAGFVHGLHGEEVLLGHAEDLIVADDGRRPGILRCIVRDPPRPAGLELLRSLIVPALDHIREWEPIECRIDLDAVVACGIVS
jgi:hypothetical protein